MRTAAFPRIDPRSSIGARLMAGFAALLAMMVVVAAMGLVQLRKLDRELGTTLEDHLPRLALLERILASIDDVGLATHAALLADDAAQAEPAIARATRRRAEIGEDLQKLTVLFEADGAEGAAVRATLEAESAGFLVGVVRLSRELKAGRTSEARALLRGTLEPKRVAMREAIAGYKARQDRKLEAVREQSARSTWLSTVLLAGITLGTAVAALLVALVITRSVVRPLAAAADLADAVARGHLDGPPVSAGSDETGRVLGALERMRTTVRDFVTAQGTLVERHQVAGDIDHRLAADTLPGEFGVLAGQVNRLVASHVDATFQLIAVLERYNGGDFSATMPALPGRKAALTEAATTTRRRLLATFGAIERAIDAARAGDLATRIDTRDPDLLFPAVVSSINQLLDTSGEVLGEAARIFGAIERGMLDERMAGRYLGAFGDLQRAANVTMERLAHLIETTRLAADTVDVGAREIAQGGIDLSARTEDQAARLQETSASLTEITEAVSRNANAARDAESVAATASAVAGEGGRTMTQLLETLRRIDEAGKRIGEIIGLIDGIAFQTNLLALNAAVEAARAGDHGRGFAMVASEVRALSQRSATAAREIQALVTDTLATIEAGNTLGVRAGERVDRVVTAIGEAQALVKSISAATRDQHERIVAVESAVRDMDEATQRNAALVEQSGAAAAQLQDQAARLVTEVRKFQGKDARARIKHGRTAP
jgi:methyl-accepting chemotaxis protein